MPREGILNARVRPFSVYSGDIAVRIVPVLIVANIDFEEIVALYFFDIDFLTPPDVMLNIPSWFKETYNPETFALSQGMLPHPEELALNIDTIEDPLEYKVTAPRYFGPKSKMYPDCDYFERSTGSDCWD